MCSRFLKRRMENYQGDLADIVSGNTTAAADWQFIPSNDHPINPAEDFGDPFTFMGDPLLQNMDPPPLSSFFYNSNTIKATTTTTTVDQETGFGGNSTNIAHKVVDDHEMKRPPNIFSRMLQISPLPAVSPAAVTVGSPRVLKGGPPPPLVISNNPTLISPNRCLVESTGMQISSPRNTGIKRRKSQAKKVVCIPAPAPANSRASGEVVPSDLWAWRKYGQKPIKGSPYPRSYYRCSSSKGCSARKQVERSRTDSNMLVITYTWEHNHPWPTQRNALAGSTRSQPSKANCASKNPPHKPANPTKQEQKTENTVMDPANVKLEEMDQEFDNDQLEIDDGDFHEGTYKPTLADSNHSQEDSFFADLGEIEADPLDLLFTQGFGGENNKDLDPFGFYDWTTNDTNITTTSYGETNKFLK